MLTGNDFLDDRRAKCESLFSVIYVCIYIHIDTKK